MDRQYCARLEIEALTTICPTLLDQQRQTCRFMFQATIVVPVQVDIQIEDDRRGDSDPEEEICPGFTKTLNPTEL